MPPIMPATDLGTFTERQHRLSEAKTVAQWIQCLRATEGRDLEATALWLERYPRHSQRSAIEHQHALIQNAASIGTGGGSSWASPLPTALIASFVGLMRELSLLGRIPGLRKVPPNVPAPSVTSPGVFTWVGEGSSKPVTTLAFEQVSVPLTKALAMIIVSEELLKAELGTSELLRDTLLAGLAAFIDKEFTDPTIAATATRPGSITNGITGLGAPG